MSTCVPIFRHESTPMAKFYSTFRLTRLGKTYLILQSPLLSLTSEKGKNNLEIAKV